MKRILRDVLGDEEIIHLRPAELSLPLLTIAEDYKLISKLAQEEGERPLTIDELAEKQISVNRRSGVE